MAKLTHLYYHGASCAANIRTRHPDGTERPCEKRGVHARGFTGYYDGDAHAFRTIGPSRKFFCDQHVIEHDAGLNVFDPDRPSLSRSGRTPAVKPGS